MSLESLVDADAIGGTQDYQAPPGKLQVRLTTIYPPHAPSSRGDRFRLRSGPCHPGSPDPSPAPRKGSAEPFAWGRDSLWHSLEGRFARASEARAATPAASVLEVVRSPTGSITLGRRPVDPTGSAGPGLTRDQILCVGSRGRGLPDRRPRMWRLGFRSGPGSEATVAELGLRKPTAADRLYRSLYGTRAAVEEAMLQPTCRRPPHRARP